MMAGYLGVDFNSYSERQLLIMYIGKLNDDWNQSSNIICSTYNLTQVVIGALSKIKADIKMSTDFHPLKNDEQNNKPLMKLTPQNLNLLKVMAKM